MNGRPALFCAHALTDGDASRCACQLGPGASRAQMLAFEKAQITEELL